MLIFITGGVRSGKSTYAEQTVSCLVSDDVTAYYIATSNRTDKEMSLRIQKHQKDRDKGHLNWVTLEHPRNLHELAGKFQSGDVVLLDCLTNLLNNELFRGWEEANNRWNSPQYRKKIYDKILNGINNLLETDIQFIIVSNEVFFESLSANEDGTYFFVELLGKLHQAIVEKADTACLVENGTPIFMKRRN